MPTELTLTYDNEAALLAIAARDGHTDVQDYMQAMIDDHVVAGARILAEQADAALLAAAKATTPEVKAVLEAKIVEMAIEATQPVNPIIEGAPK